jgi:hypothetical protein
MPMRIAPLCSGTANNARTPRSGVAYVDTGHRRTGITPDRPRQPDLAVACRRPRAAACGSVVIS